MVTKDIDLDSVDGGAVTKRRGSKWAAVSQASSKIRIWIPALLWAVADTLLDFVPIPGAAGFQVGNPCALAICPLLASLEIFAIASMPAVRSKSIMMTNYLEELLQRSTSKATQDGMEELYWIITPRSTADRGAQLSIRLQPGLLEGVMDELEEQGVVVDERKPDVVRVAPAPLYNTFSEVWDFVAVFDLACRKANSKKTNNSQGSGLLGGTEHKGWSLIK